MFIVILNRRVPKRVSFADVMDFPAGSTAEENLRIIRPKVAKPRVLPQNFGKYPVQAFPIKGALP